MAFLRMKAGLTVINFITLLTDDDYDETIRVVISVFMACLVDIVARSLSWKHMRLWVCKFLFKCLTNLIEHDCLPVVTLNHVRRFRFPDDLQ
jgi:uncharacterized protein (DUF983 family)